MSSLPSGVPDDATVEAVMEERFGPASGDPDELEDNALDTSDNATVEATVEAVMEEWFGPASGDPDELVEMAIPFDPLMAALLESLTLEGGRGGLTPEHVAYQSLLKLINTCHHRNGRYDQPPAPALLDLGVTLSVMGGGAVANMLYGQGLYDQDDGTTKEDLTVKEMFLRHNLGWYSQRHLRRQMPPPDWTTGVRVTDFLNFTIAAKEKSSGVTFCPSTGKKNIIVVTKFDGMGVVQELTPCYQTHTMIGCAEGPLQYERVAELNGMGEEELRKAMPALTTEVIEWWVTASDNSVKSRIATFRAHANTKAEDVMEEIARVTAAFRTCEGCVLWAFQENKSIEDAQNRCDSFCLQCMEGQKVCSAHTDKRNNYHFTHNPCSKCVSKGRCCIHLWAVGCAMDCCGAQEKSQRLMMENDINRNEMTTFADALHLLKSAYNTTFNHFLLLNDNRCGLKYLSARFRDGYRPANDRVKSQTNITTGAVRRRNRMDVESIKTITSERSQRGLLSPDEKENKKCMLVYTMVPDPYMFSTTNITGAITMPRGMAFHDASNRLFVLDEANGGRLAVVRPGQAPADVKILVKGIGKGLCGICFVGGESVNQRLAVAVRQVGKDCGKILLIDVNKETKGLRGNGGRKEKKGLEGGLEHE